jgi:hypothetical protein
MTRNNSGPLTPEEAAKAVQEGFRSGGSSQSGGINMPGGYTPGHPHHNSGNGPTTGQVPNAPTAGQISSEPLGQYVRRNK